MSTITNQPSTTDMTRTLMIAATVAGAWWMFSPPNTIKPGDARYEYMANYQPHLLNKRQELMTQVHQMDSVLRQMDILKWNSKQPAAIDQMRQQINEIRQQRNLLIDHINKIDEHVEKGIADMLAGPGRDYHNQQSIKQLMQQVTRLLEHAQITTSVVDYDMNHKSPPRAVPTGNIVY